MNNPKDVRQGSRITYPPPGQILGPKRSRIIISAINAFLNLKIVRGDSDKFLVTSENAVIQLKRTQPGDGGGGLTWRGEWSDVTAYSVNDLVRVTAGLEYGDTGYVAGTNYTGVWLCVQANTGERPVYPEPVEEEDVYWVMLSIGVRLHNVADTVYGKQAWVGASDSFTPP